MATDSTNTPNKRHNRCANKTTSGGFGLALVLLASAAFSSPAIDIVGPCFLTNTYTKLLPRMAEKRGTELPFRCLDMPYPVNIEAELIHNPDVDIVNLLSFSLTRVHNGSWIEDLSDNAQLIAAAEQHYDHVKLDIFRDERLIGLGYSSTVHTLPLVQLESYAALGLGTEDFPADWNALYEQMVDRAERGHRAFFYPAWHTNKSGLALSFAVEVWNRGGRFLSAETLLPSLNDNDGPALATLRDWRRVWNSGAVPRDILEHGPIEFRKNFLFGDYAVSVQSSDLLLAAKGIHRSPSRTVTLLPRVSQNWGTPFSMVVSLAHVGARSGERRRELEQLLLDISLGSGEEKHAFAEHNLRNVGLLPTYKEYMHSESAQYILREKLAITRDADVLLDIYENIEAPEEYSRTVWLEESSDFMQSELVRFLLDPTVDEKTVISRFNKKNHELLKSHGF